MVASEPAAALICLATFAHGPPCAGNRKAMPHIRAPLIPNTTSRARKSTPQRHDCTLLKPVSLNRDTLARALSWPPIAKMPQAQPELKKVRAPRHLYLLPSDRFQYLEKRVLVQLNGSRKVMGVLRGYDVRSPVPSRLCAILTVPRFT